MTKRAVYLETSVISYLTARPSRDLIVAAHQQITRDWWDNELSRYEVLISPLVLEEASKGDPQASQKRLEAIQSFPVVEIDENVRKLADIYFARVRLPEKAKADAYHLALATWHGMDFLLSWNCTHIVNGHVRLILEEINSEQGIRTPVICTPEELMEGL